MAHHEEKHLKLRVSSHSNRPYDNNPMVRVDTGADVNCMDKKTLKTLFPEVKLSVCPHQIQNFGNLIADISILGQFWAYLQFKDRKYEHFHSHKCQ